MKPCSTLFLNLSQGTPESSTRYKTTTLTNWGLYTLTPKPCETRKKSSKTLADKLESFGFTSLYELLLNRPRTYIDKSQPQTIDQLTFEEEATIIGDIAFADHMRNDAGTKFRINLEGGGTVTVTFFRQKWLKNKYPVGTQVLVTGVVKEFQGRPVITGKSIESLDVGRDIPVVPIYKQSPSKGITTKVISNATRELLCRLEFQVTPV